MGRRWAFLLATGFAIIAAPAARAEWTRSWAIEWYESANYFGGKAGDQLSPGTDCPAGIKEVDWVKVMVDAGYTADEARWLRDPANPTRSPFFGQAQMAFRGKDRANVYLHPDSTPESGDLVPVASKTGEGLDLDNDTGNGFTSPDGRKGVDNNFYKAVGCWKSYRGAPRTSSNSMNMMDGMREGGWTVVIIASGKGADPMNDPDVQLGFYASNDKLVKDANGGVAHDYSFRIRPDGNGEGVFKARTVKGRIVTDSLPKMVIHDADRAVTLELLKAKAELEMQQDGSLKGYLGGYRPWMPVYQGWMGYIAPSMESLGWIRLPDVWYAFRKFADYSPSGPDGERTHISSALRIDAVPAFVMAPDAKPATAQSYAHLKAAVPARDFTPGTRKLVVPAPDGFTYEYQDGVMVLQGKKAVSQTPEQLRPPKPYDTASTAKGPG